MSGAFRVTPRAANDLREIAPYTLKTWGRKQREASLREMDKRFAWLAENPTLGKPRPDIRAGYRSYPQGPHVVFSLVREVGIDIIGVLHQRMDGWSAYMARQIGATEKRAPGRETDRTADLVSKPWSVPGYVGSRFRPRFRDLLGTVFSRHIQALQTTWNN